MHGIRLRYCVGTGVEGRSETKIGIVEGEVGIKVCIIVTPRMDIYRATSTTNISKMR